MPARHCFTQAFARGGRISASSRALDRNSLFSAYAGNIRKSIIGHEHHPIRYLLASRMGFPARTGAPGGSLFTIHNNPKILP
jgi:hypothetical protein